jgi:hypothetical protein
MDSVPLVSFEIEWGAPHVATIKTSRFNSDAARTRLSEVARAAVEHALTCEAGEASVTIRVRRTAKEPIVREFE